MLCNAYLAGQPQLVLVLVAAREVLPAAVVAMRPLALLLLVAVATTAGEPVLLVEAVVVVPVFLVLLLLAVVATTAGVPVLLAAVVAVEPPPLVVVEALAAVAPVPAVAVVEVAPAVEPLLLGALSLSPPVAAAREREPLLGPSRPELQEEANPEAPTLLLPLRRQLKPLPPLSDCL